MATSIGSASLKLSASSKAFEGDMRRAAASMQRFGNQAKATGKQTTSVGADLAKSALKFMALQKVMGGVSNFMGGIISKGADLEEQLVRVQIASGATSEEMMMLKKTAQDLGSRSSFTGGQVAGTIMKVLSRAGFTAKEVNKLSESVVKFANLAEVEGSEAASAFAMAMRVSGRESAGAQKTMDQLFVAANNANTNLMGLVEGYAGVGALTRQLGIDFETTIATLAKLQDIGLQGSEAGTALSRAIERLNPASAEAQQAFERLGFSAFDSMGRLRPFLDVVEELEKKVSGLTHQQGLEFLGQGFDKRAGRDLLKFFTIGADKIRKEAENLKDVTGASDAAYEKLQATTNKKLESLSSSLGALQESIFELLKDGLKVLIPIVTDLVNLLKESVGKISTFGTGAGLAFDVLFGGSVPSKPKPTLDLSAVPGIGSASGAGHRARVHSGMFGPLIRAFDQLLPPVVAEQAAALKTGSTLLVRLAELAGQLTRPAIAKGFFNLPEPSAFRINDLPRAIARGTAAAVSAVNRSQQANDPQRQAVDQLKKGNRINDKILDVLNDRLPKLLPLGIA